MALIDDNNVPTTTLVNMRTASLNILDDLTHIAVGTDNTATSLIDTALGLEVLRKVFDETPEKSISNGTYDFSGLIGLTEANGNTLAETGLFNASSGGTMRLRALLPVEVAKTSSIDLSIGIRITIEVENI